MDQSLEVMRSIVKLNSGDPEEANNEFITLRNISRNDTFELEEKDEVLEYFDAIIEGMKNSGCDRWDFEPTIVDFRENLRKFFEELEWSSTDLDDLPRNTVIDRLRATWERQGYLADDEIQWLLDNIGKSVALPDFPNFPFQPLPSPQPWRIGDYPPTLPPPVRWETFRATGSAVYKTDGED